MALRCILRSVPNSLQVCKKLSTSSSPLYRLGSAVRKMDFHPSLVNLSKASRSDYTNLYSNRTQATYLVCARNFAVSSVKNEAEKSHGGDHTKLWSAERILAAGLLGVVPVALIFPSQPLDCLLALSLVMHSHWGIEAIVVDYVRPIIFGKTFPVIAHALVYVLSISTLTGLLFLIFNDCGFANAIHLLWKL
ncbi:succinate dehydrogenase [ubiquinone] cytochrome b small subunit, mitochondrial [Schistocerca americana]|uniref:succinate dehydrogenase [ubiquinone] cytochrome b small subunit, mitochondrial n=1 Tax=Schistocerca americana TaxID=7009 RepID=UPI001F4FD0AC|nr:succinate dehydrogenase [ubiquinone] cytochrome b small subunit, mitochondrial [Schistocerca americana]XP_049955629.1 succinate dehydrogenase [ubiquinone] cytochrome b small subunit, mitochondrial [Schistocerca serialis cubense]